MGKSWKRVDEAYRRGRDAYERRRRSFGRAVNPYNPKHQPAEHESWQEGWDAAEDGFYE